MDIAENTIVFSIEDSPSEHNTIVFSTDDCPPVDDLIDVWQDNNLRVPKNVPLKTLGSGDYFLIAMDIGAIFPPDEEEDEGSLFDYENWETRSVSYKFLVPFKRAAGGKLPLPTRKIVRMLAVAGVPECKRECMVEVISCAAEKIAAAADNRRLKVFPMSVKMDLVACKCMDIQAWAHGHDPQPRLSIFCFTIGRKI